MTPRILAISLCLSLAACLTEEELAEVNQEYGEPQLWSAALASGDAPDIQEPSEADAEAAAAALDAELYEEEIGEDLGPEEPPLRSAQVAWTVSDSVLRAYLVWQRYLEDSLELARVARTTSEYLDLPAELRAATKRFEVPESPDESFSRFGLTRDEVQRIEELIDALGVGVGLDPLPPAEQLANLGRDTGSSAREFLTWLRLEREQLVRERLDSLRSVYGDANVDLLLRHYAVIPTAPQRLSSAGPQIALEGEAAPSYP
ncbi:MAG: hypothetical protein QM765_04340 [Myxococcales bacterium]